MILQSTGDGRYELYKDEEQVGITPSPFLTFGRELSEDEAFLLEKKGYAYVG